MIKTVIVDDEPNCSKTLEILLQNFCPQVKLAGSFQHPQKALTFLKKNQVDLLLLDIDMPVINGFELLDLLQPVNFHIIFTTAYDDYAIKAFKYSAYDYLLKPIDEQELVNAVQRLAGLKQPDNRQAAHLLAVYQDKTITPERIALPTTDGFVFIETTKILRCESDSNYTRIYFDGGQKEMLICKTLKEIESILGDSTFLRVHHSHLVNKKRVKKLIKTGGGYLLMQDDTEVPLARSKKNSIVKDLL